MSDQPYEPKILSPNPFSYEYLKGELAFYGTHPDAVIGDITFTNRLFKPGKLNDWFNSAHRSHRGMSFPTLKERNKDPDNPAEHDVWMTITPMEIQSMYTPIHEAHGTVWTAGLGLGYFPLRAAQKETVDRVIVYELRPETIEIFTRNFSDRPYFDKIEIRQGDFIQALRDHVPDGNDYVFNDIYLNQMDGEIEGHVEEFQDWYGAYTFWGFDRVMLDALRWGMLPRIWPDMRDFIHTWENTTLAEAHGPDADPELADRYLPDWYRVAMAPPSISRILKGMDISHNPEPRADRVQVMREEFARAYIEDNGVEGLMEMVRSGVITLVQEPKNAAAVEALRSRIRITPK